MSNQPRADLLAAMTELCQRYPDWRFGQLISNVADWADHEIWEVEDEQLLEAARLHLQQLPAAGKTSKTAKVKSQRSAS
jgi:hypothetical protein